MKKYRSLEDVYTNIDQRVSPIPSQVINEWTILAADEGAGPITLGDVDDKFLRRLEKEIGQHQSGVGDLVEDLINSAHWYRGMNKQDYKQKVLAPAKEALTGDDDKNMDVDPAALKRLIKDRNTLTGFADAIIDAADNNTDFNYLDSLEEVAAPVFRTNTRAVLDRLFALDFQQNTVSVGKGEFVATLFSNAEKGEKGDLEIPGIGEVEVKGTQGRPGKHGGPLMGSRVKLPKMLLDIGQNRDDPEGTRHNVYTGKAIQKFLLNLTKSVNELKSYIDSLVVNSEEENTKFYEFRDTIRYINDEINLLTEPETIKTITPTDFGRRIDRIHTAIVNTDLPKTQINTLLSKLDQGTKSKPGLVKTFEEFHHSKDRKTIDAANEKEYSWSDVVKQYFMGDWGLEKPDIVNGFLELANEDLNDQETTQLREALTAKVDDDMMRELQDGNKKVLDAVVATIHSVLYQHKSGDKEKSSFPIMLLVNSKTKKALPLSYPGRDLKEKFLNHFDTIVDLIATGKLKIGLSVDPRSKGVQFTYTGTE